MALDFQGSFIFIPVALEDFINRLNYSFLKVVKIFEMVGDFQDSTDNFSEPVSISGLGNSFCCFEILKTLKCL